jgi:hypothetical protein
MGVLTPMRDLQFGLVRGLSDCDPQKQGIRIQRTILSVCRLVPTKVLFRPRDAFYNVEQYLSISAGVSGNGFGLRFNSRAGSSRCCREALSMRQRL